MIVYRISSCKVIADLTGTGAFLYGGRWNSKGTHLLYTAGSSSLAMLEVLVHTGSRPIADMCGLELEIPDDSLTSITTAELPANWQKYPQPPNLKAIGDDFVREGKYLALEIPSVVNGNESNYLLNPAHPRYSEVRIIKQYDKVFDVRL